MRIKAHFFGNMPLLKGIVTFIALVTFILMTSSAHGQARVDLVEASQTEEGNVYAYRIVGASFSDQDRLKRFEKANQELHKFSLFTYDETTHICRVGVGAIGGDRDEASIRYYLKQAVGALELDKKEDSREWADDDPRHGQVAEEFPTAIPEPTDPNDMPDWGNLIQGNPSIENDGGEQ